MRVIDLFAGCGGLSLGFQAADCKILSAYDNWNPAVVCYSHNFDHPIIQKDLSCYELISKELKKLKPDMIMGGPPCQDFSHAGRRSEGNKADLTYAYARIIANVRPKWFLMENVDRARNSKAYAKAKELFKESGYGLTEQVLDASLCGVPQKRKRFFCIGLLKCNDGFLNNILENRLSKKPLTIREYLGEELSLEYYYRHPRNYNRRGIFSIDEPSPTIRGVNRPVPKGYLGHPTDPIKITSKVRPLNTLERARLQTFPVDYKWTGSKTDIEQMIGNAVPVILAKFVAEAIKEYCLLHTKNKIS